MANFFRKSGSTDIVDESGSLVTGTANIQAALKTVNFNFDQLPEFVSPRTPRDTTKPTEPGGLAGLEDFFKGLDITPITEEEETDIRERVRKEAQGQLDAIEAAFTEIVSRAEEKGEARLGRRRALSSRAGILGQTFGEQARQEVEAANREIIVGFEKERATQKADILARVTERADRLIAVEKGQTLKNVEAVATFRQSQQSEARTDIENLAASGTSLNDLSDEEFQNLLNQSGFGSGLALKSFFLSKIPVDSIIHKEVVGNKAIFFTRTPSGEIQKTELDLGIEGVELSASEDFQITQDGTPLIVTYAGEKGKSEITNVRIAEGFVKGEFEKKTKVTEPPVTPEVPEVVEIVVPTLDGVLKDAGLNKADLSTQQLEALEAEIQNTISSDPELIVANVKKNGGSRSDALIALRNAAIARDIESPRPGVLPTSLVASDFADVLDRSFGDIETGLISLTTLLKGHKGSAFSFAVKAKDEGHSKAAVRDFLDSKFPKTTVATINEIIKELFPKDDDESTPGSSKSKIEKAFGEEEEETK